MQPASTNYLPTSARKIFEWTSKFRKCRIAEMRLLRKTIGHKLITLRIAPA